MAAIRALPDSTTSQIRSSFIIPSLTACVLELVQNSLDASATRIEVAVGPDSWQCRVTDNGRGIDEDDLRKLGRRYRTFTCMRNAVEAMKCGQIRRKPVICRIQIKAEAMATEEKVTYYSLA